MVTAADTSVPLDVVLNDRQHSGRFVAALRRAANESSLVIELSLLAGPRRAPEPFVDLEKACDRVP